MGRHLPSLGRPVGDSQAPELARHRRRRAATGYHSRKAALAQSRRRSSLPEPVRGRHRRRSAALALVYHTRRAALACHRLHRRRMRPLGNRMRRMRTAGRMEHLSVWEAGAVVAGPAAVSKAPGEARAVVVAVVAAMIEQAVFAGWLG